MESTIRRTSFDLADDARETAVEQLQSWLPGLIACALRLKQAHWNLRGRRFKSVHEHFDDVLESVRAAVDDVAERIATLGGVADGLPATVAAGASKAGFAPFPEGLLPVDRAIETICQDLEVAVRHGRKAVAALGEIDPVSEGLAVDIVGALEKHHWMLHSQTEA